MAVNGKKYLVLFLTQRYFTVIEEERNQKIFTEVESDNCDDKRITQTFLSNSNS